MGLFDFFKKTLTDGNDDLNTNSVLSNKKFWKELQGQCKLYAQDITHDMIPVLAKIWPANFRDSNVYVDINDSNPLRAIYPIMELSIFPSAVFSLVICEHFPKLTSKDKSNMKNYICQSAESFVENTFASQNDIKAILKNRFEEYTMACINDNMCGFSLYGQFGMNFGSIKNWSADHKVKCAHLLCDYITYIKHFNEIASFEDLQKLKRFTVNNRKEDLAKIMEIYEKAYVTVGAIFLSVEKAIKNYS